MANRSRIKELARELNLQGLVVADLEELNMGNLEYLERILSQEVESRKQNAIARIRSSANLPDIVFEKEKLSQGMRYQVEKLIDCVWVNACKNLLVIGECGTGKTVLATYLANKAIEKCFKTYYIKLDELLVMVRGKDASNKAAATFNRIKNADVLVLDEMLYLNITSTDLELLYKMLMVINETASIVFVTNREMSEWLATAEEKYTMQLLINRAIVNTEFIRLTKA